VNPTIREARSPEDWSRTCTLLQQVYVGDGYTNAEAAARFMTREQLEPGGVMLIAALPDGRVIGAVLFLHVNSPLRQLAGPREREFRVLAVSPEARGDGIGAALVRECIARALKEGASRLVLWTQPRMLTAHRLYERLAFARASERDVQDERGFTRLVYVLTV
jgi:GNAT superfamily N-acetyltransferase